MSHRVVKHLIALTILGCVTFAVYSPGLNGPFLFDDTGNFLQVPGVAMSELSWGSVVDAALSKTGVEYIHRPIPRVTFALNYYFAGRTFLKPRFQDHQSGHSFVEWRVGVLVVVVAGRQLASQSQEAAVRRGKTENVWFWFPVVVAAAWTLHPLQLTSVLYAVQRMTSLAGTGVLLGLVIFTIGRIRVTGGKRLGFRSHADGGGRWHFAGGDVKRKRGSDAGVCLSRRAVFPSPAMRSSLDPGFVSRSFISSLLAPWCSAR